MTVPAAKDSFTPQADPASARAQPDFSRELWLGFPKGGKTLHGSDERFLNAAGFSTPDKVDRIDDYRLVDGPEFRDIGVRAIEMKPQMALGLLASRRLDAAIVGRDVLKEFNAAMKGRKGFVQCTEIVDLDLAPCTLSIGVPLNDPARGIEDLQGRVIVTKYKEALERWAARNKIQFAEIVSEVIPGVPISGGIEGYRLFDPRITAICDMVESGESLVRYDWKPLGIVDSDWQDICDDVTGGLPKKQRRKYSDLPSSVTENLAGTVLPSRPVLVRGAGLLSPDKENALKILTERFCQAARLMGRNPVMHDKRVAQQRSYKTGRQLPPVAASTQGEVGHGFRHILG